LVQQLTPEVLQYIEQLEQSKVIIDIKITCLKELRSSTQGEINRLSGVLPSKQTTGDNNYAYIYS
jgi:hypothetical protein